MGLPSAAPIAPDSYTFPSGLRPLLLSVSTAVFRTLARRRFINQSGALSSYILGAAKERGLAFRYWITGDEFTLSFTDYLQYVFGGPGGAAECSAYLEDARDGEAFQAAARRALVLDKPLIIMKTGRSEAGAKASVSHTGSLAGADEVYQAVFSKNGVLRAENLDELFDLALLAQAPRGPRRKRVQVVSISGAAGILMADVGNEFGLEFADLSDTTKDELQIMPLLLPPSRTPWTSRRLSPSPDFLAKPPR